MKLITVLKFTIIFIITTLTNPLNAVELEAVIKGDVNITSEADTTIITQSTDRAVINWTQFDIATGKEVRFIQPTINSAVLNRVTDSNITIIDGMLNANGQIYIVNQHGIVFGKNAQVNTGTLVASTLDISDYHFMNSRITFNTANNVHFATITNKGNIVAEKYVIIQGGNINNAGRINAPDINIDADKNNIVNTGVIKATSVAHSDGRILLTGGNVQQKGTLSAMGNISIEADHIKTKVNSLTAAPRIALTSKLNTRLNGILSGKWITLNTSGKVKQGVSGQITTDELTLGGWGKQGHYRLTSQHNQIKNLTGDWVTEADKVRSVMLINNNPDLTIKNLVVKNFLVAKTHGRLIINNLSARTFNFTSAGDISYNHLISAKDIRLTSQHGKIKGTDPVKGLIYSAGDIYLTAPEVNHDEQYIYSGLKPKQKIIINGNAVINQQPSNIMINDKVITGEPPLQQPVALLENNRWLPSPARYSTDSLCYQYACSPDVLRSHERK